MPELTHQEALHHLDHQRRKQIAVKRELKPVLEQAKTGQPMRPEDIRSIELVMKHACADADRLEAAGAVVPPLEESHG